MLCAILGSLCFFGTLTEALQDCLTPENLVPQKSLYSNQEFDDPEDNNSMHKVLNNHISSSSNSSDSNEFNYSRFGTEIPRVKMTRGLCKFDKTFMVNKIME